MFRGAVLLGVCLASFFDGTMMSRAGTVVGTPFRVSVVVTGSATTSGAQVAGPQSLTQAGLSRVFTVCGTQICTRTTYY